MTRRAAGERRVAARRLPAGFYGAGFSLIELLVVIATISLLLSLLLPALRQASNEARATQCASNTHEWARGFAAYAVDHGGAFPPFADRYPGRLTHTLWYNQTAPYMGLLFIGPDDPLTRDKDDRNYHAPIRRCPMGNAFVGVHYGGWNDTDPPMAPINFQINAYRGSEVTYPPVRLETVRRPSHWMLLFDTSRYFMFTPNRWPRQQDADADGAADTHGGLRDEDWLIYNGAMPREHRDATNIAFCDTHVARITFDVWLDPDNGMWRDP